jgi:hypothetical protein
MAAPHGGGFSYLLPRRDRFFARDRAWSFAEHGAAGGLRGPSSVRPERAFSFCAQLRVAATMRAVPAPTRRAPSRSSKRAGAGSVRRTDFVLRQVACRRAAARAVGRRRLRDQADQGESQRDRCGRTDFVMPEVERCGATVPAVRTRARLSASSKIEGGNSDRIAPALLLLVSHDLFRQSGAHFAGSCSKRAGAGAVQPE